VIRIQSFFMLWPRGEGLEDHDGILVENEASLKEMGKDFFANMRVLIALINNLKLSHSFPDLSPLSSHLSSQSQ